MELGNDYLGSEEHKQDLEDLIFPDGSSYESYPDLTNDFSVSADPVSSIEARETVNYITQEEFVDSSSSGQSWNPIFGSKGTDILRGEIGNDFLWGDEGSDNLIGGYGTDFLVGGFEGTDVLIGGHIEFYPYGNLRYFQDFQTDYFVLGTKGEASYAENSHRDQALVVDFEPGIDKIVLHGSGSEYIIRPVENSVQLFYGYFDDPIATLLGVISLSPSDFIFI